MNVSPELVLAVWSAGIAAALFVVARWRVTSPGYAWLVGGVGAVLSLFAWAAGGQKHTLLLVAAALAAVGVAGSAVRQPIGQQWVEAAGQGLAAVAGLVVAGQLGLAGAAAGHVPAWIGAVRALTGAFFLGAVTDSMILGHWYLIDPKLPKTAIKRLDLLALVALAVNSVAVLIPPKSIVPVFTSGSSLYAIGWLVVTLFAGLLLYLTWRALGERGYASVMAATGLLYVTTMVAFAAVVVAYLSVAA